MAVTATAGARAAHPDFDAHKVTSAPRAVAGAQIEAMGVRATATAPLRGAGVAAAAVSALSAVRQQKTAGAGVWPPPNAKAGAELVGLPATSRAGDTVRPFHIGASGSTPVTPAWSVAEAGRTRPTAPRAPNSAEGEELTAHTLLCALAKSGTCSSTSSRVPHWSARNWREVVTVGTACTLARAGNCVVNPQRGEVVAAARWYQIVERRPGRATAEAGLAVRAAAACSPGVAVMSCPPKAARAKSATVVGGSRPPPQLGPDFPANITWARSSTPCAPPTAAPYVRVRERSKKSRSYAARSAS